MIKVIKSRPTLEKLLKHLSRKEKCAYVRTGDGDINLLNGENDSYNRCTDDFKHEMKEVFELSDPNFMKCLPLYIGDNAEPNMCPGNHLCDISFYNHIISKVGTYIQYFPSVYSHVSLCYQATYDPEYAIHFLKELKKACLVNSTYVIGNSTTSTELIRLFFGNNINRILTDSKDSYANINTVWNTISNSINKDRYTIFIIFMGCAGRPLQKRIWKTYDNVFIFDVGSLMDAISGQDTRAWIKISGFNPNQFLQLCEKELISIVD